MRPPDTASLRTPLVWVWWGRSDQLGGAAAAAVLGLAVVGLAVGTALALFGLPPVDTHGPQHDWGIMTPTCGGTRALRFTMLGDLGAAFTYNPLSPLLVLGAVLTLLRHAVGAVTGHWLNLHFPRKRLLVTIAVVLLGALWANQQAHAPLLMGP